MTFTISFTEQELQVLGQVLAQGPYGAVAPLFDKINRAIIEQQKPLEENA